jgi:hypothetical protein
MNSSHLTLKKARERRRSHLLQLSIDLDGSCRIPQLAPSLGSGGRDHQGIEREGGGSECEVGRHRSALGRDRQQSSRLRIAEPLNPEFNLATRAEIPDAILSHGVCRSGKDGTDNLDLRAGDSATGLLVRHRSDYCACHPPDERDDRDQKESPEENHTPAATADQVPGPMPQNHLIKLHA